jgi:hypothetical protein
MIRFLPGLCQTNSPGGGKLVMRAEKKAHFTPKDVCYPVCPEQGGTHFV